MKTKSNGIATAETFLNNLRKVAVKKEIRATHALRMLVEAHPELSRVEMSKAAERSGLNRVTACHIWDMFCHE